MFKFFSKIGIKNKAVATVLSIHLGAVAVAALRFKMAGGVFTMEAIKALAFEPINVYRVAIQGPSASDLDQTGQTVVGGGA